MTRRAKAYEIRKSPIHGNGVFAARDIKNGERIMEYLGEKISKEESNRRGIEREEFAKKTGDGAVYIFVARRRVGHRRELRVQRRAPHKPRLPHQQRIRQRGRPHIHIRHARHKKGRGNPLQLRLRLRALYGPSVQVRIPRMRRLHSGGGRPPEAQKKAAQHAPQKSVDFRPLAHILFNSSAF